jgi:hypothetical protein
MRGKMARSAAHPPFPTVHVAAAVRATACLARTPENRKNSHWFGGSYGESRPIWGLTLSRARRTLRKVVPSGMISPGRRPWTLLQPSIDSGSRTQARHCRRWEGRSHARGRRTALLQRQRQFGAAGYPSREAQYEELPLNRASVRTIDVGVKQMPAYFAYVEPRFRDHFMDPLLAYETLDYWRQQNFNNWVATITWPGQPPEGHPPLPRLGNFDLTEGAGLAMCGTTAELQAGLTPMMAGTPGSVIGLISYNKDLAAYYVRILIPNPNPGHHNLPITKTLINIGSILEYWKGQKYKTAGKSNNSKWRKLWTGTETSFNFGEVRNTLAPRAEGKTAGLYYGF